MLSLARTADELQPWLHVEQSCVRKPPLFPPRLCYPYSPGLDVLVRHRVVRGERDNWNCWANYGRCH